MGRWRVAVPILLALLVAAGASIFLYQWTKKRVAPEVVVEEKAKTVQVVVAKVYVPAGAKLTRETLSLARFLQESLPAGYHTNIGQLVDRVVVTPLKEKELVLESRLAPVSVKVGGVSALITPGKRAMAVSGNKLMGLGGLVKPGDRVDILMKTKDPETKADTQKIVFENVRVLSAGTQLGPNPEGGPSPVDMYTVELTPEEGERLALAASKGSLLFALRNVTDVETVLTTGATLEETVAYYRPIVPTDRSRLKPITKPRRVIREVTPRRGYTVEIIKGLKRSIDEF